MANWQGKTVLLVDDAALMHRKLEALYQELGFTVVGKVKNGLEALPLIEKLRPDLVSLDVVMPVMDGIECYRRIQQLANNQKCVFISCLGGEARFISAFAEEIPDHLFLAKFPTALALSQRLEKILEATTKSNSDKPALLSRSA